MKPLFILFLLLLLIIIPGYCIDVQNDPIMAKLDSGLIQLEKIQKKIVHIHPLLKEFHPIAVSYKDQLYIYDFDTLNNEYNYIKKSPPPFKLIEGIRASFPLSVYDNQPSCVVSSDIFDSLNEMVLIFHEFIHCSQANTVEYKLKDNLTIHQQAMKNSDYMWEINHPFPYSDTLFVNYYDQFLNALKENNEDKIFKSRQQLKKNLSKIDYEFMTWQEWKEGLARYIENLIKRELGLEENFYGKEKPYHRVTFYYGGEAFIDFICKRNANLVTDLDILYNQMYSP